MYGPCLRRVLSCVVNDARGPRLEINICTVDVAFRVLQGVVLETQVKHEHV